MNDTFIIEPQPDGSIAVFCNEEQICIGYAPTELEALKRAHEYTKKKYIKFLKLKNDLNVALREAKRLEEICECENCTKK